MNVEQCQVADDPWIKPINLGAISPPVVCCCLYLPLCCLLWLLSLDA